ncbi:hypothetical protein [Neisseria subflava]|uniref:hypothetical protein n=1 Tax=Neisseria subflava TaxID=28449 RepID=UPI001EF9DD07|nr:hypothetical protein [Neisseria subflava]
MKLLGAGFVAERTFSRSRRSRGGLSIVGTSQGRPSETDGASATGSTSFKSGCRASAFLPPDI